MAFWNRKPATEEPDELLIRVQRGVVAAIGSLQQQLQALATQMRLIDENATAARGIETRLMKLDTLATGTRALLEDQVQRLDSSINQIRGNMTGGMRGARRDRQAEQIGSALTEMLGADGAHQLVSELAARTENGQPLMNGAERADSPIGG